MHILEAALFANLLSNRQTHQLPEQWRPVLDKAEPPSRPLRAVMIRAITGMVALCIVIAALTIVSAGPVERPVAASRTA